MRILYFIALLLALCNCKNQKGMNSSQKENKCAEIIKGAIEVSKSLSLYSNTTDWPAIEKEVYTSAENAESIDELKPALELLLNGLRDHHGAVRRLSDNSILAHFTDYGNSRKQDNRVFDPEIWKIVNDVESRFSYSALENKIGYLKIVGVGPNVDGQMESNRIRNALTELNADGVDKWIIDLRYNGGGNINVMLSGIAPLLDTSSVLSIQGANDDIMGEAIIENGNFTYYGNQAFEMSTGPSIENPKIAVLTSRWTVSSGEFVAVAFKGQKNTKFFGENTGGYTTNTGWEILEDQVVLSISTGVYCDRNGIKYVDNVKPDMHVEFEVENDIKKDVGVNTAITWLLDQ